MLDKSLQYFDFIMKMPAEKVTALPEVHLPDGYVLDFFREGDELSWARLEAAVLEFPSEEKALEYFKKNYSDPFTPQLKQRCVFVREASSGKAVSTATAWFMPSSLGNRGWLQWISTDPAHQGKGLARAAIVRALQLFPKYEPGSDIYLHTQTWSHKAIYLYHKLGFEAFDIDHVKVTWDNEEGFRVMHNDTAKALKELEKVYSPELIASLKNNMLHPTPFERTDHPPAQDILFPADFQK
jgi:GNAT superfamily N-acetyltransferase